MNDNQIKSQFWRERLEAQKSSGLSIHTWCLENQIPQSQFEWLLQGIEIDQKKALHSVDISAENSCF